MTIRKATLEDAANIARIHIDTWRDAYRGIIPESYPARLSKESCQMHWTATLSKSCDGTIVALDDHENVIGWASTSMINDGHNEITLWVLEKNHRTRRFYEAFGFTHKSCWRFNGWVMIT